MFAFYYAVLLVITFPIMIYSKNFFTSYVVIAFLFAVLAFFMIPKPGMYVDSVRFFNTIDQVSLIRQTQGINSSLNYLFNYEGYDAIPLMGVIIYAISFIKLNGMLLFFSAFVDVFFGIYLVNEINKNRDKKNLVKNVFYFLCLFEFNAAITGVRSNIVDSVGVTIGFLLLQKKIKLSKSIFLFFLLTLIHPFSITIFLIIMYIKVFGKNKYFMWLFYILLFFQERFQQTLFSSLSIFSSIPFFSSILFKSNQYFGDNASILASSDYSIYRNIIRLCFFAILFVLVALLRKKIKISDKLFISVFWLCLGSFGDQIFFGRCVVLLFYISLPYINELQNLIKLVTKKKYKKLIILLVTLCIVSYSCVSLFDNIRAGVRFNDIGLN
ncbi:hypothetical protein [Liquorilactobacillus cacaonum]|uniref:EpsG family protein n=1 Tax=Liquorilactobacillus cacaonum DSM 21116 TaxID=1423729 RepID=A0A0R2CHL2_9LACO|nr:hypothetical protein [Liquorilactobacillus cacaonum]KRM91128.1 hypothetical protein FC80_GL001127 [Liquorilactobacillus cacaonum DSM 21116]